MGLERVASVLADLRSNYDTELFTPIFAAIQVLEGAGSGTGRPAPPRKCSSPETPWNSRSIA